MTDERSPRSEVGILRALTERDNGDEKVGRNAATSGRREQPAMAFPANLSDSSRSVSAWASAKDSNRCEVGILHTLIERGSASEYEFREALGIEDGCCPSCMQDEAYGPLVWVTYKSDNGVWVDIETCCVHQAQIKDGLIAAGIEAK